MAILEIGCCGAYYKICIQHQREKYPEERSCRGCKLGYDAGNRDLNRAKCQIKLCCFRDNHLQTCADCSKYPCDILMVFFSKGRTKYRKQLDFLRHHGYPKFLKNADQWNGASGKLNSL